MSIVDWEATRDEYSAMLSPPDVRGGCLIVEQVVAAGASVADIVAEVLRPAQIEVGRRWQLNQWTVADEHAASAVADAALMSAVAASAPPQDMVRGQVVMACAHEEWHTLPLRMVAEVVRASGLDVIFLGASVPPDHLRKFMEANRPVALALHCSHPLTLEGARESIAAAHTLGVPVLVGGRGFAFDDHRANLVGADGWTDDPRQAVDMLSAWASNSPTALGVPAKPNGELLPSDDELSAIRKRTVSALVQEFPALDGFTAEQWARTNEDIESIVRYSVTAVRLRDDTILTDFIAWLRELLAVRGVPTEVLNSSLEAIASVLTESDTGSGHLLREQASRSVKLANFG